MKGFEEIPLEWAPGWWQHDDREAPGGGRESAGGGRRRQRKKGFEQWGPPEGEVWRPAGPPMSVFGGPPPTWHGPPVPAWHGPPAMSPWQGPPPYTDHGETLDKLVNIVDGLAQDLRQERAERQVLEDVFYGRRSSPYGKLALEGKDRSSGESETGSGYGKARSGRLSRGWASVLSSESPPFGPRNALK